METICAWCLEEQGEEPQEDDSHGICNDHAGQMILAYHWQGLQRVPSYVEQNAADFVEEGA